MAAIPSSVAATPAKEAESTSRYKKALSFRWTISIEAYKMFGTAMTSPCFSVLLRPATSSQPELNSVWHLRLYYDVLSLWQGSWLHTKQEEKSDCHKGKITSCRFFILNENQEVVHSTDELEDRYFLVNDNKPIWVVNDVDRINYRKYFFNGKLTIQVEADLFFFADTMQFDSLPSDEVSKGIYSLYKEEVLTDTIIKCQDKEFKVHRVILASQSSVIRAMFEVDMKEKQSGVIEVSDITPEAMSDLVTYLYTGTAPNLKTLASELLEVADKYQLPRLLSTCETELGDMLKEAGAIGTLILADLHGRVCLKKACLEYIRLNSARVFETSEWADFRDHKNQYSKLYTEVLEYTLSISS